MDVKSKLQNMVAELDAEARAFEQEEWAKISNTTLAEYRKKQDDVCNEGIAALQNQRDAAIATKTAQLKEELSKKTKERFSAVRAKLEEAILQFDTNGFGE